MTAMASRLRSLVGPLAFAAVHLLERANPLRRRVEGRAPHVARNLAIAAGAALVARGLERPVVDWIQRIGQRRRWGLVRRLGLPPWAATALSLALLDWTLYLWHVSTHRVPALWRFHRVHHADLDLDASTALRFHPGELLLAVPFRAIQVVALGVAARPLILWETLVLVFILFHHSNLRLPSRLDRLLGIFVITPRVHGIHHSRDRAELHRNFGTLSSLWDRLHGLRVTDVAQESIHIGLPGQPDDRLGVVESLAVPFHREPPAR